MLAVRAVFISPFLFVSPRAVFGTGALFFLERFRMPSQSQLSAILIVLCLAAYVAAMEVYAYVIERRFAPLFGDHQGQ